MGGMVVTGVVVAERQHLESIQRTLTEILERISAIEKRLDQLSQSQKRPGKQPLPAVRTKEKAPRNERQ